MSDDVIAHFPDLIQGDSYDYKLRVTDAAGNPVNIAGWVLRFLLKMDSSDPDDEALIDVSKTVPDDEDSQAGIDTFSLTSEHTAVATGTHHLVFKRIIPGTPDHVKTLKRQAIAVVAP